MTTTRKRSASRTATTSKTDPKLPKSLADGDDHFTRNLVVFLAMVGLCVFGVQQFFASLPPQKGDSCDDVSLGFLVKGVLPTQVGGRNDKLGTLKTMLKCAEDYRQDHPNYVVACFASVYISLQTFAIPGPVILSLLSGALYDMIPAQILVAFCATTGATLCFLLSYFLGAPIARRLIPGMIKNFREKIDSNRGHLWYYMLFLRITPLLPNWFVNVASPIVGVPVSYFFTATLIGLVPANFLHVTTGATLNSVAAGEGGLGDNVMNFAILFCLQFVALLPTLFKRKIAAYEQKQF